MLKRLEKKMYMGGKKRGKDSVLCSFRTLNYLLDIRIHNIFLGD